MQFSVIPKIFCRLTIRVDIFDYFENDFFAWLYDKNHINYTPLGKIICVQLYGIKYSYPILTIYTQLYGALSALAIEYADCTAAEW